MIDEYTKRDKNQQIGWVIKGSFRQKVLILSKNFRFKTHEARPGKSGRVPSAITRRDQSFD
jgi:hypothetical protein